MMDLGKILVPVLVGLAVGGGVYYATRDKPSTLNGLRGMGRPGLGNAGGWTRAPAGFQPLTASTLQARGLQRAFYPAKAFS
jgi:hypothetical protein